MVPTQINKLHGVDWTSTEIHSKFTPSYFKVRILHDTLANSVEYEGLAYLRTANDHAVLVRWPKQSSIAQGVAQPFSEKMVLFSKLFIMEERPEPCLSNIGADRAFCFRFNPDRQWRRGFCSYNSFLFGCESPTGLMPGGPSPSHEFGFDVAAKILQPEFCSLEDALEQFKRSKTMRGRVISKRYWCIRSNPEAAIQLFRNQAFVGSFVGKRFFPEETAGEIMKEELKMELPILKEKFYAAH